MADRDPWETAPVPPSSGAARDPWEAPDGPAKASAIGDVTSSIIRGLAKGTIHLAGLPGDMRELIGAGVAAVGEKLGYPVPDQMRHYSPLPMLASPTSEQIEHGVEKVAGKFGHPETTAGKFAQSAAEFLPSAVIGGGGLPARVASAVAGGLGSEAAGELTEGTPYEGAARIAGGLVGGLAPGAAVRAVTPNPVAAERKEMLDYLKSKGVTAMTAGQQTGNRVLRYAESELGDAIGAGGKATEANEKVLDQFTKAAMREAGERNATATPKNLNAAYRRIGDRMNNLAARNVFVKDAQFAAEIATAEAEYKRLVAPSNRAPAVDGYISDLAGKTTAFRGDEYKQLRSDISRDMRRSTNDPQLKWFLGRINRALDGAMERSIAILNPDDVGAFSEARKQYRNLMVLEDAVGGAGEASANGLITPQKLRAALDKPEYAYEESELAKLARAGVATLTPLPQSGTAPRAVVHGIPMALGGLAGHMAGGDIGTAATIAGSVAGPGVAGRALMSPPVQGYLANQLLPGLETSTTIDALVRAAVEGRDAP